MITLIIILIGVLWLILNRSFFKRTVPGQHLAMPSGTIRAFLSMVIVSFPLTFWLIQTAIPSGISNAIFIVVAFYFQGRTHASDFKEIVYEIKNPKKSYHVRLPASQSPFYLPQYSVRTILLGLMVAYWVLNGLTTDLPFVTQSNILDIFQILLFFGFGKILHEINDIILKKRYIEHVTNSTEPDDILMKSIEKLEESKGDIVYGVYAIIAFIATVTTTILYTFGWDLVYVFYVFGFPWTFYLRNTLLFFIAGYFGYK